jgi:hypothetical protein
MARSHLDRNSLDIRRATREMDCGRLEECQGIKPREQYIWSDGLPMHALNGCVVRTIEPSTARIFSAPDKVQEPKYSGPVCSTCRRPALGEHTLQVNSKGARTHTKGCPPKAAFGEPNRKEKRRARKGR